MVKPKGSHIDRKGRWLAGRGDRYGSFCCNFLDNSFISLLSMSTVICVSLYEALLCLFIFSVCLTTSYAIIPPSPTVRFSLLGHLQHLYSSITILAFFILLSRYGHVCVLRIFPLKCPLWRILCSLYTFQSFFSLLDYASRNYFKYLLSWAQNLSFSFILKSSV